MKPQVTLTQLEEEPETSFLGLTFTEVKGAFTKAFLVIILVTVIASFFVSFTTAPIIGMVGGAIFFYFSVRSTASNRADKPLYYHRHLKMYKNAKLIIQAAKYYQRERTNYESAKKQTKK